jgi:hypothetical protein
VRDSDLRRQPRRTSGTWRARWPLQAGQSLRTRWALRPSGSLGANSAPGSCGLATARDPKRYHKKGQKPEWVHLDYLERHPSLKIETLRANGRRITNWPSHAEATDRAAGAGPRVQKLCAGAPSCRKSLPLKGRLRLRPPGGRYIPELSAGPLRSPEREQRRPDFIASRIVRAVLVKVDPSRCTIVLANS